MSLSPAYEVSGWTFKPDSACLIRPGETRQLTPQLNRLLLALIEADEQTLSKDALVRAGWNRSIVSDDAIARAISELRKALRSNGDEEPITTLHGFGYKLNSTAKGAAQRKKLSITIAFIAVSAAIATVLMMTEQSGPPLLTRAVTPMTAFNDLEVGNRYLPVTQRLVYLSPSPLGDSLIVEEAGEIPRVLAARRIIHSAEATPSGDRVAFIDLTEGCELRLASLAGESTTALGSCLARASRALAWTDDGKLLFAQLNDGRLTVYEFTGNSPEISTIQAGECNSLRDVARRPDGRTYFSCELERGDGLFESVDEKLVERLRYRSIEKFAAAAGEDFYLLHAPRWKAGITRVSPPDEFVLLQSGPALDLALVGSQLTLVRDLTNPDLLSFNPGDGSTMSIEDGAARTLAFAIDEEGSMWQLDDRAGPLALYRNGRAETQFGGTDSTIPLADVTCMQVNNSTGSILFAANGPGGSTRTATHDLVSGALLRASTNEDPVPCLSPGSAFPALEGDPRAAGKPVRQAQGDPNGTTIFYLVDRTPYVDVAVWDIDTSD